MSGSSIKGQQYPPIPRPPNPGNHYSEPANINAPPLSGQPNMFPPPLLNQQNYSKPPLTMMGQQNFSGLQPSGYQMQSNIPPPMTNTSGLPKPPMYSIPPTTHGQLSNSPVPNQPPKCLSPMSHNNQNMLSNASASLSSNSQNLMSNMASAMPPTSQNSMSNALPHMPPSSLSMMSNISAKMPPSNQNVMSNMAPQMSPSNQSTISSTLAQMPPSTQSMIPNTMAQMPPKSQNLINASAHMPTHSSPNIMSNVSHQIPPSSQNLISNSGSEMPVRSQSMMSNTAPQIPPSSQSLMSNSGSEMPPRSQNMMSNTAPSMPPSSQSLMSNSGAEMPSRSQSIISNTAPQMPPSSQNLMSNSGSEMPPRSQSMMSNTAPPMPQSSQNLVSSSVSEMPQRSQSIISNTGPQMPQSTQNLISNSGSEMPPRSQSMMSNTAPPMPQSSQNLMSSSGAEVPPKSQSMMSNTTAQMPPSSTNLMSNSGAEMSQRTQSMMPNISAQMPPRSQNISNTSAHMPPSSQNVMSCTMAQMPPSSQNMMSSTMAQMPPSSQNMMPNTMAQISPSSQNLMSHNAPPSMPPSSQNMMPSALAPNHPPMYPVEQSGQSHMPPLPGYPLQKSGRYPTAPPMSGQAITNPGLNRQMPSSMTNYQQGGYPQPGYHNQTDMYARNPYQSSPMGSTESYQPGMQPQQARRLDPEQMPSPIQVIQDDQCAKGGVFITNQIGLVPPLVTTKFVTQDQGNASPRYIRSTMYTVPTNADILKQTMVPFALIINPMARVEEGEYEPPIVDMGEIGPVRCVRCKAYMSPFMQFIDAGRRFQCMFCRATTEVPAEYFQHLDHRGQRMDRYERPELMLGTYEYIATKEYCRNNVLPKPPAIVFVIDVSYNMIKSGLVNLLCAEMKSIIKHLPVDVDQVKSNMKVGFITYNNTVHFYNVNPCLTQPQMMVVGDVQDVFMPLLDGFLCDIDESEVVIDSLMAQIPAMFADTRETETILAPAIRAGLEALKASECAGKLIVFHSSLPIAEAPGKLKNRDDRKLLGTDKEKSVLAPQNNVYNNLGQECVDVGCSVDLFIFNNSYVDIATIGQICRLTGGEVYKYTYFQADVDGGRLVSDIITNISRPIAFDARMRLRTSTGVRATEFYGHFFMSNTTEMELASIDCNKAVAVEIKHDDKLAENEGVYIQAALLYTSCGGVRRLRILNLSLKNSSQITELYRTCDLDAIVNYFSKQSVFKLIESTPRAVKDNLISRCANMLAAYRKNCASTSNAGQLILPECMKLLPLYVNCILKSDAITGGSDMTIDDRSFVMQAVATMPVSISVVYMYPRLLPLHDIDPDNTELPQMLRCSFDKFTEDGAYLLENSVHMFLWLGVALSPLWVKAVFDVISVIKVDTDRTSLPILDNPLNKRIREIIDQVRHERHRCMRLTIVRQREKLEMVLRHFLIEDRGNDGSPSYVDFLCHMHKEIRELLKP
ncbi:protein transport protein Sec24C [Polistes fuscatus]|uniref:protein transport protein Sec24C n=1 Tax=Polistes fuscatus TaxID=30207 RepID=UPI001CA954A1|nr:protein transport protein Sec24C [Polistes fuscatus]XP_043495942.1 protein transport protein Sec24C [Polistes fuscatus]